jgi:hypothetical protein
MQRRPAFDYVYGWRYLMKENAVNWVGSLLIYGFLVLCCAGTEFTQEQVDDAYKGRPVSDIHVMENLK